MVLSQDLRLRIVELVISGGREAMQPGDLR